ncbi:ABC transporter permease, partial [Flavobacterium sp. UBA4854]
MSIISLIIKREFIAKVRNKSFVVMTFLSPLLFVAIAVFIGYLSSMKAETKRIAIHDETGIFISDFLKENKKGAEFKYLNLSEVDVKALKDSITKENFNGLIVIPKTKNNKDLESKVEFISNNSPSISFIENT